jgi:hypothetical protein
MGQDIREMMRDYQPKAPKLSAGHEERFLKKLNETSANPGKTGIYMWMRIAALVVVAIGIGSYFYFNNNGLDAGATLVEAGTEQESLPVESRITLGDLSPGLKKIEDYYRAGINVQLASLDVTDDNRELVDSYMEKLDELGKAYQSLNLELNQTGPTEATITALIDNLQLRLELLFKLKKKLQELKNQNNENYNVI